ncbi:MAG: flagellar export protein FliJ [Hydrogenophaga sp.]|uniref:flagellar export protein FliJ n=1 Tax=Hydrogenophaga sp. TaxID=1904254 RepID=UPI0016A60E9A|nr:flagellar export protein FliJ [Hydrogenophaga sp.]NIM43334.1 flagellar export protein FliJ [Hydrogenophaga sp.]NIN28403.1 flagellar export protein FliJ [Hydrogenophaga sp.]NIN29222.1 flagellar export protein FliJ [Hydrogenophaga sp.]NIN57537.1 flagellar export protein FliJ [Hydrogenophaga sp.]NIO53832.1 flagellar export protein FliJ [Hydrogenophaga sp.]
MNPRALEQVVQLREREQERVGAVLAEQERTRQRFVTSISQLGDLLDQAGATGALPPTLASNLGAYKLSVLDMADRHRTALARHESQMDQTRLALHEAFRRREAVAQLHERRLEEGERALLVAERKRTDDVAQTVWLRGRA